MKLAHLPLLVPFLSVSYAFAGEPLFRAQLSTPIYFSEQVSIEYPQSPAPLELEAIDTLARVYSTVSIPVLVKDADGEFNVSLSWIPNNPGSFDWFPNSNTISGIPALPGLYDLGIEASTATQSAQTQIKLEVFPEITVSLQGTTTRNVGQSVQITPTATGVIGTPSWSRSPTTTLPAGLSFNNQTGQITGIATQRGHIQDLRISILDSADDATAETSPFSLLVRGDSCISPWNTTVLDYNEITTYQNAVVTAGTSCATQSRSCANGSLSGSYQHPSCSPLETSHTNNAINFQNHLSGLRSVAALHASSLGPTFYVNQYTGTTVDSQTWNLNNNNLFRDTRLPITGFQKQGSTVRSSVYTGAVVSNINVNVNMVWIHVTGLSVHDCVALSTAAFPPNTFRKTIGNLSTGTHFTTPRNFSQARNACQAQDPHVGWWMTR